LGSRDTLSDWWGFTDDGGCRNITVKDAARKVMGDVTIAYIESAKGVRVAEDEIIEVGKNDVTSPSSPQFSTQLTICRYYPSKSGEHEKACVKSQGSCLSALVD